MPEPLARSRSGLGRVAIAYLITFGTLFIAMALGGGLSEYAVWGRKEVGLAMMVVTMGPLGWIWLLAMPFVILAVWGVVDRVRRQQP